MLKTRGTALCGLGFGQIELAYKPDINKVVEIYTDGPYPGISTENNISAWFFLRQLGVLTGEARWTRAAERIRAGLLRAAWNDPIDQFIAGFRPDGSPIPPKPWTACPGEHSSLPPPATRKKPAGPWPSWIPAMRPGTGRAWGSGRTRTPPYTRIPASAGFSSRIIRAENGWICLLSGPREPWEWRLPA